MRVSAVARVDVISCAHRRDESLEEYISPRELLRKRESCVCWCVDLYTWRLNLRVHVGSGKKSRVSFVYEFSDTQRPPVVVVVVELNFNACLRLVI